MLLIYTIHIDWTSQWSQRCCCLPWLVGNRNRTEWSVSVRTWVQKLLWLWYITDARHYIITREDLKSLSDRKMCGIFHNFIRIYKWTFQNDGCLKWLHSSIQQHKLNCEWIFITIYGVRYISLCYAVYLIALHHTFKYSQRTFYTCLRFIVIVYKEFKANKLLLLMKKMKKKKWNNGNNNNETRSRRWRRQQKWNGSNLIQLIHFHDTTHFPNWKGNICAFTRILLDNRNGLWSGNVANTTNSNSYIFHWKPFLILNDRAKSSWFWLTALAWFNHKITQFGISQEGNRNYSQPVCI